MIQASITVFPQGRISFVKNDKTLNGNTMGSVIFGFFKWNKSITRTKAGEQGISFIQENINNDVPYILDKDDIILFPSVKLLKEKYSTN